MTLFPQGHTSHGLLPANNWSWQVTGKSPFLWYSLTVDFGMRISILPIFPWICTAAWDMLTYASFLLSFWGQIRIEIWQSFPMLFNILIIFPNSSNELIEYLILPWFWLLRGPKQTWGYFIFLHSQYTLKFSHMFTLPLVHNSFLNLWAAILYPSLFFPIKHLLILRFVF